MPSLPFQTFQGTVRKEKRLVGPGQEVSMLCLAMADSLSFPMRRRGGHPHLDPELHDLLDKKVCISGELLADMTLLVMGWSELD